MNIVLFTLICLFLVSCTPEYHPPWGLIKTIPRTIFIDESVLMDDPCALPCWKNIAPGKTTSEDALEVVMNSNYIEPAWVKVNKDTVEGGIIFEPKYGGRKQSSRVNWINGTVTEITLGLTFPFTIEDLLAKYGIPEGIKGTSGGSSEHFYILVTFYYPSKGSEFIAYTDEGDYRILSSTSVDVVRMYTPMSIEERIKTFYFGDETIYPKILEKIRKWKGYGDVIDIYYGSMGNMSIH